jgi:hypothetical protein
VSLEAAAFGALLGSLLIQDSMPFLGAGGGGGCPQSRVQ